eukprot:TRINITY_DN1425_c0_g1_i1.p1 TRINITY_DN1425_c0_g1~~TRINITY_DN1425_c0_g1_i1.p1  ORF type:complete len:182 (-),score=49.27 TRINITY_DN1425_c0_g1_i1:304-819(-)
MSELAVETCNPELNEQNFTKICSEHPRSTELQVVAKTLTGKMVKLTIESSNTIWELKEKIFVKFCSKEGIPTDQQRLIFGGRQLENHRTLEDYNIPNKAIIDLILRLRGGMFHESSGRLDMKTMNEWNQFLSARPICLEALFPNPKPKKEEKEEKEEDEADIEESLRDLWL